MKDENIVLDKSKTFAIRIVKLYKYLTEVQKEYVLSKQLLRSGTSIGANISEADCAMSRNDFLAKMYIAYKECAETIYWLDLLKETEYINEKEHMSVVKDCEEIFRILSSITKTTKEGKEQISK